MPAVLVVVEWVWEEEDEGYGCEVVVKERKVVVEKSEGVREWEKTHPIVLVGWVYEEEKTHKKSERVEVEEEEKVQGHVLDEDG